MIRTTALLTAALAACVIAAGCSSESTDSSPSKAERTKISELAGLNGGQMPVISYQRGSDRVSEIEGRLSETKVNNKDDAMTVICELADIIGCSDPVNELRYDSLISDGNGWIYEFGQYYKGVPVRNGSVSVSADADGNTSRLISDYVEGVAINTEPKLTAEEAKEAAKKRYSCETNGEPTLLIISNSNGVFLTWDVHLNRGSYPDETYIEANGCWVVAENGPIDD